MHSVTCSGLGSLECFVITKCTKFGQLILRKIILKKFKGPTSKGRGKEGGEGGEGSGKEKGKGRDGEREREGKRSPCSDFAI